MRSAGDTHDVAAVAINHQNDRRAQDGLRARGRRGPGALRLLRLAHQRRRAIRVDQDAAWVATGNHAELFGLLRQGRRRFLLSDLTLQLLGPQGRPRFDRLADAMGGFGVRVTKPNEIRPALEKARDSGSPALVDVVINRDVYSSGTSNQTMYK